MTSNPKKNFYLLFSIICWFVFLRRLIQAQSIETPSVEAQPEEGQSMKTRPEEKNRQNYGKGGLLWPSTFDKKPEEMHKSCADDDEAERTIALAFMNDTNMASYFSCDDDSEVLKEHGNSFFLMGEIQKAIRCFNKAIRMSVKEPRYRRNRGLSFLRLGNIDLAAADFQRSLKLDPQNTRGLFGLSKVFSFKGDVKKEVEYLETASDYIDKHKPWARDEKYQVTRRLEEAEKKLLELEKTEPQNEKRHKSEEKLRKEESETIYFDPCAPEEVNEAGLSSWTTPLYPLDERYTAETDSVVAETLRDWGNEFFTDGDLKHALRCYNKALNVSNEAKFLRNRALCHSRMNESDLAIVAYEKSLELEPQSFVGHFLFGFYLFDLGKFTESIEHLQTLLDTSDDEKWNRKYHDVILNKFEEAYRYKKVPESQIDSKQALYTDDELMNTVEKLKK